MKELLDLILDRSKQVAELLKVLANENRLNILCHLMESPMNVTEIHEKLPNMTQSALSQHLAILKAHKILSSNKQGLCITYKIHDDRIVKILSSIRDNYCEI